MQYNSSFSRDLCICVRACMPCVSVCVDICVWILVRWFFVCRVPKHLNSAQNYFSVIANIQINAVQLVASARVFNYYTKLVVFFFSFAMCKFNQNLFLISICGFAVIEMFAAAPVDFAFLDDLMDGPSYELDRNHDLKYDQRQNGTENLRLNVDGVIIAFPASTSNQATSAATNLAANYLLQLAAASDEDDDGDYLPFLKNNANNANNENAVTATHDKGTVAAHALKDDKNSKKKSSPKEPAKVVVVKEVVEVADPAASQPTVEQQQQAKVDVIPAKKVQSRRKNK